MKQQALKFDVADTGGGCKALMAEFGILGEYALITAHDDASLPVDGEPVALGVYGPNQEELYFGEFPSADAAKAFAHGFITCLLSPI